MYRDRKDAWADSFLWGVTLSLLLLVIGLPLMLYFNLWQAFVR